MRAWYLWNYGSVSDFTLQVRNRKMWSWFNLHILSPPCWRIVCALFQRAKRKKYRFLFLLVRTLTSTWLKKKKQKTWSTRGVDRSTLGTFTYLDGTGLVFVFLLSEGFRTIYDIRPPSTCISIYLVSLTYTLFFQNHKHRCWNFMWKRLRGWKLTPLWSLQPRGGCGNKSLFVEAFLKCFLNMFQVVLGRELK